MPTLESSWKIAAAVWLLGAAAIALPAQTFTTLLNFDGANGATPETMALIQGTDGNFYGVTSAGGASGLGTIFRITPDGAPTTLYSFSGPDGSTPFGGLVLGTDGNFYGTTKKGGAHAFGTVYKITPEGAFTSLHSFNQTDGANPLAPLLQASDGNFYGTASAIRSDGFGTIFKLTPEGVFQTLHTFDLTHGEFPWAPLIQATDGNLYGTTPQGGSGGFGTIFNIAPAGTFHTMHNFNGTDGGFSYAALMQAADGNFYGTTDGANRFGTIFKFTPAGVLTTLCSFTYTNGARPYAGLIQATDGNLYGTTTHGGTNYCFLSNCGTIFEITPEGQLTTLHDFNSTDGANPVGALLQSTDGNFYGTTSAGGANFSGTVFKLSLGLDPFLKVLPASGKPGDAITILGTNLFAVTSVAFNGTPAAFTVNASGSAISANVPAAAGTGMVSVVTAGATLRSNVAFEVLQPSR